MSMEALNTAFQASNSALYSAQIAQLENQTQQQLMNINQEMQSTAQKGEMQRFQIMYDTQTKVMEMQQDMTLNRAKSQDKMFGKWDEFVKQ